MPRPLRGRVSSSTPVVRQMGLKARSGGYVFTDSVDPVIDHGPPRVLWAPRLLYLFGQRGPARGRPAEEVRVTANLVT
jgi:hypothetical protein